MSTPGDGLARRPASDPEEIHDLYEQWVDRYDADVERWGYATPQRVAQIVVADGAPPGPVFDAGCGTGLSGQALHDAGVEHIVGADFSPASVHAARARGVYADVVVVDLNAPLPFADDRFAATVSVGVFSYIVDPPATIRELLRITEAGGVVVVTHRSDLWATQHFEQVLDQVAPATSGIEVTGPHPYLPAHPEFGEEIEVRDVVLRVL